MKHTDWTKSGIEETEPDEHEEYISYKVMNFPSLRDPKSPWNWQDDAMCSNYQDVDFFPRTKRGIVRCKTICDTCVVKAACLDFALRNHEKVGVWGGLTHHERKEMYK